MAFGAAVSEHPQAAHAVGEVTGQVLEALVDGGPPDVALLFLTGHHADAFTDAVAFVRRVLRPGVLLGCVADGVVGNGREVEGSAGVSLWAGHVGPVHAAGIGPDGRCSEPPFRPSALVLLADPLSFPATSLAALRSRWPRLPVVGASVASGAGGGLARFVVDDEWRSTGAVAGFLGPGVDAEPVTSQGGRPVGHPLTVTAADGHRVLELAGRPAVERLEELIADELREDDAAVIDRSAVHVGRLADEAIVDPGRGDYLVGPIVAARPLAGWLELAEPVGVGATLQFHLRDVDSADDDLRAALTGRLADGALLFPSLDRGRRFFDQPHHDAGLADDYLRRPPLAGVFGSGVFGHVGGRSAALTSAAALLLLRAR